jgi:hypothetical protein
MRVDQHRSSVVDAAASVAHQHNIGIEVSIEIVKAQGGLFPYQAIFGSGITEDHAASGILSSGASIGLIPALVETGGWVLLDGAVGNGHFPWFVTPEDRVAF